MRTLLALLGNLLLASTGIVLPASASLSVPSSGYIHGVVGHPQSLPLDCEARSAADWAAYWGVAVAERTFFQQLPKSDNPETGFVGNVYDAPGFLPPRGYGVYAAPVATLLRAYGLQADAQQGASWSQLESEIASGRPVIAWFLYGFQYRAPLRLTASDGRTYQAAPFEHTGILIGYDAGSFTLVEAFSGRVERVPRDTFLASWSVLGNQAVFGGRSPAPASAKPSGTSPASEYVVQRGDTLAQIARQFGLNWRELAQLNGLTAPYRIFPGQALHLALAAPLAIAEPEAPSSPAPQNPVGPSTPRAGYVVQRGDTLAGIAQRYGLNWITLAGLNQIGWPYSIYPGQRLDLQAGPLRGSTGVHVVQRGESLSTIARSYGLAWPRLAAVNGLLPPYAIYPGQVLRLP